MKKRWFVRVASFVLAVIILITIIPADTLSFGRSGGAQVSAEETAAENTGTEDTEGLPAAEDTSGENISLVPDSAASADAASGGVSEVSDATEAGDLSLPESGDETAANTETAAAAPTDADTESVTETPADTEPAAEPEDDPSAEPDGTASTQSVTAPAPPALGASGDNYWDLNIVFFDSAVDGGQTPLQTIDWDATVPNERGRLNARTIQVQITYRNTNSDRSYAPGELTMTIPNIMAGQRTQGTLTTSKLNWSVSIPANDASHTGYDWTLTNSVLTTVNYTSYGCENFIFTNGSQINEDENFEGTLTITYTLTSEGEYISGTAYIKEDEMAEIPDETCTHTHYKVLQARLTETAHPSNLLAESNQITFDYRRTYYHPWTRRTYELDKYASRLDTMEGLPDDAADYIWVEYEFEPSPFSWKGELLGYTYYITSTKRAMLEPNSSINAIGDYPNLNAFDGFIVDTFPEDTIVLSLDRKPLPRYSTQQGDGITYRIPADDQTSSSHRFHAIVGYPRSVYNEENENLHITNTAELHGTYIDRDREELLATADVELNLSDFEFVYHGDLYRVDKYNYENLVSQRYTHANTTHRYQDIIHDTGGNAQTWYIVPTIVYPGFPIDIVIGDDMLYSTGPDGTVTKLEDDDYYFSNVNYWPGAIYNTNGFNIERDKYDCELWVRRAGRSEYELYDSFRNGLVWNWNFTREDAVVGFYFVIKDCREGFSWRMYNALECTTHFIRQDIPQTGRLHNFDFLEIYRNVNGERILQNEPPLSSYATNYTQQEIAAYDQEHYGHYRQRGTDYVDWRYYNLPMNREDFFTDKILYDHLVQEADNSRYTGTFRIAAGYGSHEIFLEEYLAGYDNDAQRNNFVRNISFYDLLPEGMELLSTVDEIRESMRLIDGEYYFTSNSFQDALWYDRSDFFYEGVIEGKIYDLNFQEIPAKEFEEYCRDHLTVNVERNWNGTGRTRISVYVDLSERPVYFSSGNRDAHMRPSSVRYHSSAVAVNYRFAIPYTSLEDYGTNYLNYVYGDPAGNNVRTIYLSANDQYDMDGDGSVTDRMSRDQASIDLTFDAASMQGLTKLVQTDHTDWTTRQAQASLDSDYRYRLRASTGNSRITNLVIYDAVEGQTYFPDGSSGPASGGAPSWSGNLTGVDTSFAESQGYQVRVYWSPEELPGSISEDESWALLTEEDDLSQVRALAFEYLDESGQPAVINENKNTYVEILMHSPTAEAQVDSTAMAYNGSWANWNALDENGHTIQNITGIQSNITRVIMNEQIEIPVEKIWRLDHAAVRPESIEVALYADGEPVDNVTLSASNNWAHTFTGLWRYNDNGSEIVYTVEETNVPDHYTVSYVDADHSWRISEEPAEGHYRIVNEYTCETITGRKVWVGDSSDVRPSQITVHLLRNGEEFMSTTTDAAHNWTYEFADVDIWDENGEPYRYEVIEDVTEGYQATYDATGPVTVRLNSECSSNKDYLYIYYRLNGRLYQVGPFSGGRSNFPDEIHLPSSDLYFYWTTDTYYNNYFGFKIDAVEPYHGTDFASATTATLPSYAITEVTADSLPESEHGNYPQNQHLLWHYTAPVEDPTGFDITNTYYLTSVSGQKIWVGDSGAEDYRPETVTVELLQNGVVIDQAEVTAQDNWAFSFTGLQRCDENGAPYEYVVREAGTNDFYEVSYSNGSARTSDEPQAGYTTIINTFNRRVITGTKSWTGDTAEDRPASITVRLLRNGEEIDSMTTTAADNWRYRFVVPARDENGDLYEYDVVEDVPEGYHVSYTQNGPVTVHFSRYCYTREGDYLYIYYRLNGVLYRINKQFTGYGFTSVNIPSSDLYFYWHTDNTNDNYFGYRVDSIVPYTGNDFAAASRYSSLPNYTVQEAEALPQSTHYPYRSNLNEVIHYPYDTPSPTSVDITNDSLVVALNVTKQWQGEIDGRDRPESVTVELLQNGELYQTVEVTAQEGWTHRITGLPKYDENGDLYAYSVRETDVPAHYIVSYQNGSSVSEDPADGFLTVVNTYTRRLITGRKNWVGDTAADRPDSITLHLLQNGTEIASTTTDAAHNWEYSFETDIWDENGEQYEYQVIEDVPEGYRVNYNGRGAVTVRFNSSSYTENGYDHLYIYYMQNDQLYRVNQQFTYRDFTTVNVPSSDLYFVWRTDGSVNSGNGYYGFEVASVEPYSGNSFAPSTVYSALPSGYQLIETESLPAVTGSAYVNNMQQIYHYGGREFDITNTYQLTSVSGQKIWSGDTEDQRPESITVELLQNGTVFRTQEVTAEDNWSWYFSALPRMDDDGNEYEYSVREAQVPDHYRVTYSNGTGTSDTPADGYYDIINTSTRVLLTGQKRWSGDAVEDRPAQITVYLLQNGTRIASTTTSAAENWQYEFSVDQYDENGQEYVYTVEEAPLEDYRTSYVNPGPVTVRFDSRSECESTRYDYLYVYYRQDGRLYRLGPYGGAGSSSNFPSELHLPTSDLYFWWHTDGSVSQYYGFRVESIEAYDGSSFDVGSSISYLPGYTIQEVGTSLPESAHLPYNNNSNQVWHFMPGDLDITNEYNYTSITVSKSWDGDIPETRPESVTLTLLQNGEEYRTQTVTADENWQYTFTGLPIADASGIKYRYSVREDNVTEAYTVWYSNGGVRATGPSEGYYNVINQYNYTTFTVWKYWYNDTEADRPGSIELVLTQNGQEYRRHTLTSQENWTYTFTELPIRAGDGSYYNYSVYEAEVPDGYQTNYSTYSNGASIYNYCTLQTVMGQKYWIGDDPADRPETITVTLYRDGEKYATTTTSAAQDWKYTFRVPMADPETGRPYVYTVSETEAEGYETRYLSSSPVLITFADDCDGVDRPEGESWGGDNVVLFFRYGGQFYRFGNYTVDELAGLQILCPSGDLFFGYYTEPSSTDRYGWGIADIRTVDQSEIGPDGYSYPPISQASLDISEAVEYTGSGLFTTPHPDTQTEPTLWHYRFLDLDNATSKPEPFAFDIVNIRTEEPPEETTPEETTPEETTPEETTPEETTPEETTPEETTPEETTPEETSPQETTPEETPPETPPTPPSPPSTPPATPPPVTPPGVPPRTTTILEPRVPLAVPGGPKLRAFRTDKTLEIIEDEDVPLALPQTSDSSSMIPWMSAFGASGATMIAAAVRRKKRKEEDE